MIYQCSFGAPGDKDKYAIHEGLSEPMLAIDGDRVQGYRKHYWSYNSWQPASDENVELYERYKLLLKDNAVI